ncbi:Bug family tripartite tricarboxylate transporter substrate binding protein [Bordetella sp. 02P26C-1]|uniref:Bug family tripartite tricarboxylate transporter substrate binding protein n=1 Tax=Bordetella sp. 02P26C-1 TaxID=2683195 RepID=UPI00135561A3|nr:tripartite tricarboxylate transporter substrate binding protein [Bordetella sp. 02P26C-1]MVW80126.1 tripartite tricarboxylate transporter substrate binding protein [Bordetella sp. 02P26C-1]
MKRRTLLSVALAACALFPLGAMSAEPTWPSKPVKLIVAYPPGGATDTQARIVAKRLSEKWGQPVIVENKPGGNTVIATDPVAKANPDGYTLLLTAMPVLLNPILMEKLPYDADKDLVPVTTLTSISNILVAAPDFGVKNVPELIAKVKANPGSVSFASAGVATSTHLSAEQFASMTGTKMTHVPYKGSSPAHQDLISGRVQIMFDNGALQLVKAGRVVPLGVTSAKRLPWLPDVPTIAEQGVPGYEASAWYGIFAPGGTDPQIVDKLAKDITEVVRAPDLQPQWEAMGAMAGGGTPQEFRDYLKKEKARWEKVIREQNIKY